MPSEKPQVIVRVTAAQKEVWEAAATRRHMALSAYIRMVVDADAQPSKGAGGPGVGQVGEEPPKVEPLAPFEGGELTEPGGAKPEAGAVMPPGSRRDTDARRAALGARSLDVPGSVSSGLAEGGGSDNSLPRARPTSPPSASSRIIRDAEGVEKALAVVQPRAASRASSAPDPKPVSQKKKSAKKEYAVVVAGRSSCRRWMHHRASVWCKECGKTP